MYVSSYIRSHERVFFLRLYRPRTLTVHSFLYHCGSDNNVRRETERERERKRGAAVLVLLRGRCLLLDGLDIVFRRIINTANEEAVSSRCAFLSRVTELFRVF